MSGEDSEESMGEEFSTRVKDLEERHNLLKERVLLLGQSFLKQEGELRKDINILKDEMQEMKMSLDNAKESLSHIIQETENFVRKEDLQAIEKYIKIWEPLRALKAEDIEKMVENSVKKNKNKSD